MSVINEDQDTQPMGMALDYTNTVCASSAGAPVRKLCSVRVVVAALLEPLSPEQDILRFDDGDTGPVPSVLLLSTDAVLHAFHFANGDHPEHFPRTAKPLPLPGAGVLFRLAA